MFFKSLVAHPESWLSVSIFFLFGLSGLVGLVLLFALRSPDAKRLVLRYWFGIGEGLFLLFLWTSFGLLFTIIAAVPITVLALRNLRMMQVCGHCGSVTWPVALGTRSKVCRSCGHAIGDGSTRQQQAFRD